MIFCFPIETRVAYEKMALHKLAHEAGSEKWSNDHGGNVWTRGKGTQTLVKQGRLLMIRVNNVKQGIKLRLESRRTWVCLNQVM